MRLLSTIEAVWAFAVFLVSRPAPKPSEPRESGKRAVNRAHRVCRDVVESFND